jgi:hypothetical protein
MDLAGRQVKALVDGEAVRVLVKFPARETHEGEWGSLGGYGPKLKVKVERAGAALDLMVLV